MKITVSQLRRIIKEEVQRSLRESVLTHENVYDHLWAQCPDGNVNPDALEKPVQQVANDLGMSVEELSKILSSGGFETFQQERQPCISFDGETVTLYPV